MSQGSLIATTGKDAIHSRKRLVSFFPNRRTVVETTMRYTEAALREGFLSHSVEYQNLSQRILLSLVVGVELTKDIKKLILAVTEEHETSRVTEKTKEAYKNWIDHLIQTIVESSTPQTSILSKTIQDKMLRENLDLANRETRLHAVMNDSFIRSIPELLTTAKNLALVSYNACLTNCKLRDNVWMEMEAIGAEEPLESIFNSKLLDELFHESLWKSDFKSDNLPRYTSKGLMFEDTFIPAHTVIYLGIKTSDRSEIPYTPKLSSVLFAPFSYGNRPCPGQKLVEYIFKTMMFTVFTVNFVPEEKLANNGDSPDPYNHSP